MDIRIDAIQSVTDIPECVSVKQIQQASAHDKHSQHLKNSIIVGWPSTRDEVHSDLKPYWCYNVDLVVIDGKIMKGRQIIITMALKQQVLDQLYTNHMGIRKIKLLAHESIYWVDINTDIEKHKKTVTCLQFQQMQP